MWPLIHILQPVLPGIEQQKEGNNNNNSGGEGKAIASLRNEHGGDVGLGNGPPIRCSLLLNLPPPVPCTTSKSYLSPPLSSDRRPLRSARGELQTSEPSTATTASTSTRTHRVTVHDRERGVVHEFLVPEDQYVLHTAEAQNISLPFACRHGCCTSCAVRVKSGQIRQPEALGISAELKDKGYALLCVGFPSSDIEVETQDEDEVYWLQFGRYFARGPVERDDYALELAMGDE